MARCKLTRMNLRNIRKSKEYQCLLIDFVSTGVIGKAAAEGLLGYAIPAGLIAEGNSTVTPEPEGDDDTGDDDTENVVTLVHFNDEANAGDGEWVSQEYTLTGDRETDVGNMQNIIAELAESGYENLPTLVELNPAYEEGVTPRADMYISVDPYPEDFDFADGQILKF